MKKLIITFLLIGFLASCGSPRTVVKVSNKADGTETTISATTGDGGTTTVQVSPKLHISASPDSLKNN